MMVGEPAVTEPVEVSNHSNETDKLLNENDKGEPFYADSAYSGAPQEAIIKAKGMENKVCEKGARTAR